MCSPRRSVVVRLCVVALLHVSAVFGTIGTTKIVISEPTTSRLIQYPTNLTDTAVHTHHCSHPAHDSLLQGVFSEIQQSIGADDVNCGRDVQVILDGIRKRNVWALKILDTGPHVPTSFVYGNNFWFGASDLCHYVNDAPRLTLTEHMPKRMRNDLLNSVAPVRMRHRMLYANCSGGMQVDSQFPLLPIVHIGLCMPASCSDEQVVRHTQAYFSRRALPIQSSFDMEMNVIATKDMYRNENEIMQTASFQLMLLTIGFAVVVLVANIVYSGSGSGSGKCDQSTSVQLKDTLDASVLQRIAKCFNIGANLDELYHHPHPERDVAAVAAFRSIVCVWVLVFHVNYHSAFTLSNLAQVIIKMEWFVTQPIFQAFLYVDVFFVISSILMVYNFLKNDTKRQTVQKNSILENVVFFGRHILHRYVRLTPVVVMTMIFSDVIYNYLDEYSPYLMNDRSDLYCKETWWHNVLYVQNLLPLDNICGSWSWYLACDMQYYIIGMLVLFVYAKMPHCAKSLYIFMSASVVLLSYHITSLHQLTYKIDIVMANLNMLYANPVIRMSPFLGGAFCGWLLYKTRYAKFRPAVLWVALYWSLVVVLFGASIFYTYNRNIQAGHCALLWSLGKFVFGLYIGSIMLMCHWGNGELLKRVFAHALFQHLSKLTYSIYMVSPLVITILHGGKEVSTHFDEMQTFINALATSFVSYVLAVLLAVFYEVPFQKLSDEFVMKRTRRTIAA